MEGDIRQQLVPDLDQSASDDNTEFPIGGCFPASPASEEESSGSEVEKKSISDWTINPDNNPYYVAIMKTLLFHCSVPVFALCTTLLPKLIESNDTLEQLKADEDWLVPLASWLVMNGIVAAGQSIGSNCQVMPFKEQTILKAMSTYFFVFGSFIAANTLATISSPCSKELNNVLLSSLSGCTAALFAQFFLLTCNNQSPLISCAPQFKINHEAAALLPVLIAFVGPDILFSEFQQLQLSEEWILAIKVSLAMLTEFGCAALLVKKSRQEPGLYEDFDSQQGKRVISHEP